MKADASALRCSAAEPERNCSDKEAVAMGRIVSVLVELRGFEPLTFSLRMASSLVGARF